MASTMHLLLRQTRQKVRTAVRTIDAVAGQGFPNPHSKDVLDLIKDELLDLEEDLGDLDPQKNAQSAVQTLCQQALQYIFEVLPILGLAVRSIDVAGPIELHGPLLRLTHRALGKSAKLVISSEWDFSPYTVIYPDLLNNSFVLVGLPVTEADNALISPLAGHELGHNIWASGKYEKEFGLRVQEKLCDVVTGTLWSDYAKFFGGTDKTAVDKTVACNNCEDSLSWSLRQCEEVFCDAIALLIFREGYLHAWEYLLSPGTGGERVKRYPTMTTRAKIMSDISGKEGIPTPTNYAERFVDDQPEGDDRAKFLLTVADEVTKTLVQEIYVKAKDFVATKGLSSYSEDQINRVLGNLRRAVPATRVVGIENIVIAGWRIHLSEPDIWVKDFPQIGGKLEDQSRILNELLLKSFEVYEIEQLQAES